MPRDIQDIMSRGVDRDAFIKSQETKAPRRKPVRARQKPSRGTLFALRNKNIAIREAALRRVQIVLTYVKITTGERKKYVVAPYELKFRRLKDGMRKVLYAYDMEDKHIKNFVSKNIKNVALTDRKFVPKWPVKIK